MVLGIEQNIYHNISQRLPATYNRLKSKISSLAKRIQENVIGSNYYKIAKKAVQMSSLIPNPVSGYIENGLNALEGGINYLAELEGKQDNFKGEDQQMKKVKYDQKKSFKQPEREKLYNVSQQYLAQGKITPMERNSDNGESVYL
jgi:hypothetical protein